MAWLREAPFLDEMVVRGHRPVLALVVDVEEVFDHRSTAFLRSGPWRAEAGDPEGAVPRRAVVAQALERPDDSLEELDRRYGPSYEQGLYG